MHLLRKEQSSHSLHVATAELRKKMRGWKLGYPSGTEMECYKDVKKVTVHQRSDINWKIQEMLAVIL